MVCSCIGTVSDRSGCSVLSRSVGRGRVCSCIGTVSDRSGCSVLSPVGRVYWNCF